ncbi:prepilin-type N-terminal cleavage/methylation domain-containing protein [Arsukibacterium sp.]|uniref:prepilin-type N-terminal cleavage/methylation domain-containing protein n=1 Tax=Arsukibacterium sp. TaxID=1977258 RepID=UPI001BD4A90B|nr:prepilin-type N-terminal cleavage/methylation domain-containing protein [Arsukibacterium sp.]
MKRNQAGFTLIELIIVIVILGILAVTAAPKFLDFSGDARKSTLTGVKGALESASSLIYGKAIIAGQQSAALSCFDGAAVVAASSDTCPTGNTDVVYGYPAAEAASLRAVAELAAAEWDIDVTGTEATITPVGYVPSDDEVCEVTYVEPESANVKPEITVSGDGC